MRSVYLIISTLSLAFCSHIPQDNAHLSRLIFEPHDAQANILRLIKDARKTIEIALYGLENDAIAEALVEAHAIRNIKIRMSTEYDSESSHSWQKLIQSGIPVNLGNNSGIMHNKYLIFDRKHIITGSTNLTKGMFKHFNNSVVIKSEELIKEYMIDFEIQFLGHYASAKDDHFTSISSANDWYMKEIELGSLTVTPFFTPYKDTIRNYTNRRLLKDSFKDSLSDCSIESSHSCYESSKLGAQECKQQSPVANNCPLECYHTLDNRVLYRYVNFDKEEKMYCVNFNHALNIIVPILRNAKKSIMVFAFAFTDRVIMQELINAYEDKKRNVDVKVWIERSQYRSQYRHSKDSFAQLKKRIGFVKLSRRSNGGLLHHKVLVIDDNIIILGSLNFSNNAVNNNDENFLVFRNAHAMAKAFREEAARIDKHSYYLPDFPGEEEVEDNSEDPSKL